MADRLRFDKSQLEKYFTRILLPEERRTFSVSGLSDEEQLRHLELLKKHHLVTIPFENLTLHYSWHRVIDVSPRHLYHKIVKQHGGRGGYCMEVNSLFHTLLLSLGFNVYMAGARVYNPERKVYGGFSHCVNIVIVGCERFMIDVGFGGNGPSAALPLRLGCEYTHVAPAMMRFVQEPISQNTNQDCKLWIYQHRVTSEADWVPMYCFVDFEFILEDIRGMNLSPWKSPSSWFTQKILVTRFTTRSEDDGGKNLELPPNALGGDDEIDGVLIMDDKKLKWRRNGNTVLETELASEEDRVAALKRYFNIELADEDREAIRGTVGEIVGRERGLLMTVSPRLTRITETVNQNLNSVGSGNDYHGMLHPTLTTRKDSCSTVVPSKKIIGRQYTTNGTKWHHLTSYGSSDGIASNYVIFKPRVGYG